MVNILEIYERIKKRRKEIGLSAEQVAEKLGVSPATIYRYEKKDIKKFPTEILEPLSNVLRTTPAYLMGWEDEENIKIPTDRELKFALFDGDKEITDEQLDEVKRFAKFIKERDKNE